MDQPDRRCSIGEYHVYAVAQQERATNQCAPAYQGNYNSLCMSGDGNVIAVAAAQLTTDPGGIQHVQLSTNGGSVSGQAVKMHWKV